MIRLEASRKWSKYLIQDEQSGIISLMRQDKDAPKANLRQR